jgi:CheY-like chemotaxis protein
MPIKRSAAKQFVPAPAPAPKTAEKKEKPLVLVVDDDLFLSGMFQFGLERAGFDVIVARDGIEGYDMARARLPDAILCDVMMPNLDGFGTLQKLKEDPATKDIPVIMLTSLSHQDDIDRAKEMGAATYLIKSETLPNEAPKKIRAVLKK